MATGLFARLLTDGDAAALGALMIERARRDDWAALRFVLERLEPRPRRRAVVLDLPPGASRADRLERVLAAMARGELAPDEALQVIRVIDRVHDAREADETLPRAQQGEGPGGGPGGAASPASDTGADLNSACIVSTMPERPGPAAGRLHSACIVQDETLPRAQPVARRPGQGEAEAAHAGKAGTALYSPCIGRPGDGAPPQARRPRTRGRIVYFDGSIGSVADSVPP